MMKSSVGLFLLSLLCFSFVFDSVAGEGCPYMKEHKEEEKKPIDVEEAGGCPYLRNLAKQGQGLDDLVENLSQTLAVPLEEEEEVNGVNVVYRTLAAMPGPKPTFLEKMVVHGNNDFDFINFKSIDPYVDYANTYGDLVHYHLSRGGDFVLVSDASDLKYIYESDSFYARPDTPYFGYTYGRVVGKKDESLFNSVANGWGPNWFKLRGVVDQLLHEQVPHQLGDFNAAARELVARIKEYGLNDPKYVPYLDAYKSQIRLVGKQTYGSFFTEDVAKQFDVAVMTWVNNMPKFLPFPYQPGKGWPFAVELMKVGLDKQLDIIGDFSRKVLEHKRKSGDYGKDWLGLLASRKDENGILVLTDEEVVAVSFDVFILGSVGPGPITIEYGFYLLGSHPDLQQKLRDSLKDWKSTGKDLSMADLMKNHVLHNTFREVLRSYPAGGGINGRMATKKDHVGGFILPNGTNVIFNALRVQHDVRYWDRPEEFNPDRFLNKQPREPYAYAPFGGGKRRCPGFQHATLQMMVAMAHLYKEFDVTYQSTEAPEMIFQVYAQPKKHFPILFKKAPQ